MEKPNIENNVSNTVLIANSKCENSFNKTFNLTLIPTIRSSKCLIKYTIPFLTSTILFSSLFCLLFYPNYYPSQGEVWTTDLVLGFIVYIYFSCACIITSSIYSLI